MRLIGDTPQLWRLLNALKNRPAGPGAILHPEDVWLKDLQVRVVRRGNVTLACKGGVNEGSHNHNDCGGFMIYMDGMPLAVDAGNMTYTGATFSEERYSLWNIRSRYHSVPQIGEYEQVNGWDHGARDVRGTSDGIELDLAPAYPKAAGVVCCKRTLSCDGGGVTLRDVVRTERPQALTEVFMLRDRDAVRIIPSIAMSVKEEEIPVTDPRMARNFPGSLWRVAFAGPKAVEHDITFRIERKTDEQIF